VEDGVGIAWHGARAGLEERVHMDLDRLLVLEDQQVGGEGESLLESAFPEGFCVLGADGSYLTTPNNFEIFQRVAELVDDGTVPGTPEFQTELESLLEDADELAQDDYDEAYEESLAEAEDDADADWEDEA
jgi:hypothetical protein